LRTLSLLLLVGASSCARGTEAQAVVLLLDTTACRRKAMEIAVEAGVGCHDKRARLEALYRTDPNCARLTEDAGTGIVCKDAGGD
jgi:hypothetical protein